jgi:L-rhamnose mutarotase
MSINKGEKPSTNGGTGPSGGSWKKRSSRTGWDTYSIYLDPATRDLFAYVEFDSEERWNAVASTDVCRRWWAYMRDIMPSNPITPRSLPR